MAGDVLVQTLLPPAVARRLKQAAEREGLSVSASLRRLVMTHQNQAPLVRAWSRPGSESFAIDIVRMWDTQQAPQVVLGRVASHVGGTEFRAYNADLTPFTREDLVHKNLLAQNIADGWFALEGSMTAWRVVNSIADTAHGGQIVLTLVPEERHGRRRYDLTPSWWRGIAADDPRRDSAEAIIRGAIYYTTIEFTPGSANELSFTIKEGFGGMKETQALELQRHVRSELERLAESS